MLDIRVVSSVLRRWRLPALLAGITMVGGATAVRSTVERLHDDVREVRRLRARLAERRREIVRQRQEPAAVAPPAAGVVSAAEVHGVGEPTASCAALALELSPMIMTLASLEEPIAEPPNAFREWPVQGTVSSPFGWRNSPFGEGPEWHPGIDITAPYGTPVHATAEGEVVAAGRRRGYGALVVLDHGGTTTRYAHLSAIWVRVGQRMRRGEPLGALGGSGRATAPHLHYEVRLGHTALDPECLLATAASITPVHRKRWERLCAVVRAQLDGWKVPTVVHGATHTTTSHAGVAG